MAQNVTDLVDPTFMHIYGETQAEKERNPRFRYLPPLLQKFQQALVHHENWVGFDSNLSPKQRKYFTEQLFASLPVDFSKVSEASLISLGILEKNTLKNASPEAREEIIKTAISALRRIFLHANAIPGSQRIYEIHDFEPEREERRPPWNGMFLVFQNSETLSDSPKSPGKNTPKKMSDTSFSVYSSVYRVARGMEHSVESLQAAKSQLRTAITELLSTIEIWRVSDPQELKELLQVLYEDLRKKTTPEVINALQARIGLINFSHAQIDTSRLQ